MPGRRTISLAGFQRGNEAPGASEQATTARGPDSGVLRPEKPQ